MNTGTWLHISEVPHKEVQRSSKAESKKLTETRFYRLHLDGHLLVIAVGRAQSRAEKI